MTAWRRAMAVGLAVLAAPIFVVAPAASAADVVIYRCVAADGAVTLQNGAKCPKGSREEKRVLAAPAAPAPVALPAAVPQPPAIAPMPAPTTDAPTPAVAPVAPLAPPPLLHACVANDGQRYFSDTGEGTRCAPLEAVGLDGRSAAPAQACEVLQDRCTPLPEAERCAAWAERRRVAVQALTFSPEQADVAAAEIARVDAATAGTVCVR